MNQLSLPVLPVVLAGLFLFSCKNTTEPQSETNATPKPDTLRITPVPTEGAMPYLVTEGTVFWSAKKSLGSMHTGQILVSGGELMVNQGQLLSGNITMDMRSITATNMNDAGEKNNFESHLKDKDFFEVNKFPEAQFTITEILPSNLPAFNHVVRGDLTIKKKTHPVNIPVNLTITGDELRAESASFLIDRTKWDISFRSGVLGTAKDKIVEDIVPISLKIKAKKK